MFKNEDSSISRSEILGGSANEILSATLGVIDIKIEPAAPVIAS